MIKQYIIQYRSNTAKVGTEMLTKDEKLKQERNEENKRKGKKFLLLSVTPTWKNIISPLL